MLYRRLVGCSLSFQFFLAYAATIQLVSIIIIHQHSVRPVDHRETLSTGRHQQCGTSSVVLHTSTAGCQSAPGLVVCCTVTLACPEAIRQDTEASCEIEAWQLSRQWGNDLLPPNDPRPPSIAYPPRSRSQAHLSCLIKPFSFMYSVFTLNGGGDDDTLMFWTVISLMRLCLTDSRSTRAAERKQQKH